MNTKKINRTLGLGLMLLGTIWLLVGGSFDSCMLTMIMGMQVHHTNQE